MKGVNLSCLTYYKTLGTPDRGTCSKVTQIIGLLQAHYLTYKYLKSREGRWGKKNIHKKDVSQDLIALLILNVRFHRMAVLTL